MLLSTVIGFSKIIFWPNEYFAQYVYSRLSRKETDKSWINKIFQAIKINNNILLVIFFYVIINGSIIKNTNNKNSIFAKRIKFILASEMLKETYVSSYVALKKINFYKIFES